MTYRSIKPIDPAAEERYWERNLKKQSWWDPATPPEEALAWARYGWEAAISPDNGGRSFAEVESELAVRWKKERRTPDWSVVRNAVRSAYERILLQRSEVVASEAAARKRRSEESEQPAGPPAKNRRH